MKGLKITLWVCAVCCLLGFAAAGLPWQMMAAFCQWFGVQLPSAEPLTVYVARLCLAICGAIGVFFAILARDPLRYGAMLLLAAYGLLGYGFLCLVGGTHYALPVVVYAGDVVFGVVAGGLILVFRRSAIHAANG